MEAHLQNNREWNEASGDNEDIWPSFMDWEEVIGSKAELLAGNHRVEALKDLLAKSQSGKEYRWWTADIYDKGRFLFTPRGRPCRKNSGVIDLPTAAMPAVLQVKLRANREDATLVDNHGQIWADLVALESTNNTSSQGSITEYEMKQHLSLSGSVDFPLKRLCTLWKSQSWKAMITELCRFAIGRSLFNITKFEWMRGCRVDDVGSRKTCGLFRSMLMKEVVLVCYLYQSPRVSEEGA